MIKKIVIAGGTGFIGKYFKYKFQSLGYEVFIISRQKPHIQWQDKGGIVAALENSEMLINLAGKSVDCRYTEMNRSEILLSRTRTTQALGEAILQCTNPPQLWINSSTATIYRHAEDRSMTEDTGEIGTGFSVNVAKSWEQSFFNFQLSKTRQVALRTAIVLGKNGGAIKPLKNLVRFGIGGKQGNGKQMFSWIHIEDVFNIVLFLQSKNNLEGVFNCSSPNPIDNNTLMKSFREKMKMKIGLPSPKWLLEAGAVFIRTETELVLKSRWVVPGRLLKEGYNFKFPLIDPALENLL